MANRVKKRHWLLVGMLLALGGVSLILMPWLQRVTQTALLPERDFVEEYRQLRGPLATEADGFWLEDLEALWWTEEAGASWEDPFEVIRLAAVERVLDAEGDRAKGMEHLDVDFKVAFDDEVFEEYVRRDGEYGARLHVRVLNEALDAYVADKALQALLDGWLRQPNIGVELEDGQSLVMHLLPTLSLTRSFGQYETSLMRQAFREKDWNEAVSRLERAIGLAELAGFEPCVICLRVELNTEKAILRGLRDELALGGVSSDARDRLRDVLEQRAQRFDLVKKFKRNVEAERLLATQGVYRFFQGIETEDDWYPGQRESMPIYPTNNDLLWTGMALPRDQIQAIDAFSDCLIEHLGGSEPNLFGCHVYPLLDQWEGADQVMPLSILNFGSAARAWEQCLEAEELREEVIRMLGEHAEVE